MNPEKPEQKEPFTPDFVLGSYPVVPSTADAGEPAKPYVIKVENIIPKPGARGKALDSVREGPDGRIIKKDGGTVELHVERLPEH